MRSARRGRASTQVYIVSRGTVRVINNPRFNQVRNSYEIIFDANTTITLVRVTRVPPFRQRRPTDRPVPVPALARWPGLVSHSAPKMPWSCRKRFTAS